MSLQLQFTMKKQVNLTGSIGAISETFAVKCALNPGDLHDVQVDQFESVYDESLNAIDQLIQIHAV